MIINYYLKIITVGLLVLILLTLGASLLVDSAHAAGATFSITPGSGEFRIGQTVTALIAIHSGGNVINAAEATINFPSDLLDAVSISKTGSIFTLWPEEPKFDNVRGVISFVGGTTPPVAVSNGRVISVTFRVRASGESAVSFSGARILLADGKGTNIYSGAQGATWKLTFYPAPARTPVPTPAPKAVDGPSAPKVVSSTHPDSNKWYNRDNPKFSWTLPPGIIGVNILGDKNPDTDPGTQSDGLFDSYEYFDVDDGIWYFHIRLRNSHGWGDTAHFKFQIDTVPPTSLTIELVDGRETDRERPRVRLKAEDGLSGIDRYELKIDKGEWFDAATIKEDDQYVLPSQTAGEKTITARVFDKAGNSIEAKEKFTILIVPPAFFAIYGAKILWILGVAGALLVLLYVVYRFLILKLRLRKEVGEAERSLHKAFDILRDNIKEQIKILESAGTKRELTTEEGRVLRHLKGDLDKAEKLIKRKIGDIEKSIG